MSFVLVSFFVTADFYRKKIKGLLLSLQAFKRYISDMTFFREEAEFCRFFCQS